ncbi:MAG: ABC transporter ATP-binding protein [Rhodospirillales bacterium]|nr:ABC transporter ATP-binding protein [Rhodospirillales bacterium]
MDVLIDLQGLKKHFGAIAAVDGVSLRVHRGEVMGFLGPNGAGKTTTMRMITGFLRPDGGTAIVVGKDVSRDPISVKRTIGYLPEGAPLYGDMTPASFLAFVADVRGVRAGERAGRLDRVRELLHLGPVWLQPIDTLSKGFKRRVGLAQAILLDPEVLILDEPTDGLDPNQKHEVRALLTEMAANKAIIISTHILEEVEAVCSRAVIIARGRVVADETPEALLARSRFHNAVTVRVAFGRHDEAAAALRRVATVARVETQRAVDGAMGIVAFPADGAEILDDVHAAIEGAGVPVEEIGEQRGRLDDVFRALTADSPRPSPAEAR